MIKDTFCFILSLELGLDLKNRQVPMNKNFEFNNEPIRYLIIGSGRLASHLARYFNLLNEEYIKLHEKKIISFNQWNRRQPLSTLNFLIKRSTHALLAISDSAIERFYEENLKKYSIKVVHFSGSLFNREIPCVHPLMTFGPTGYSLVDYRAIHFVVTHPYTLRDLLPDLNNSYSQIPSEMKAYYHAHCVIGGNFTTILIQKMLAEFQKLNIPKRASQLYIDQILKNVFTSPNLALTGPLARKDQSTVANNLNALQDKNDPFVPIYHSFVKILFNEYFREK